MSLLDYHQALLREAANTIELDATGVGDLTPLLNLLRPRIPGMDKRSWSHLTKLRNTIYHNEFRHPTAVDLATLLESAPKMRNFVLGAAQAALDNERVMSRMVQRLLATALEMRRELPTGRPEWQAPWVPKIDRAVELTKLSPTALTDEGAELLLELTKGVEASRTFDQLTRVDYGEDASEAVEEDDLSWQAAEPEPDDPEPAQPEPEEFDPSEYYPEPEGEESADPVPPDYEPPGRDSPDENPRDQRPPDSGQSEEGPPG